MVEAGLGEAERREQDARVHTTVEAALTDIERRGDAAVREMLARFDGWAREDFRLSAAEIEACLGELAAQDLDDSHFAQAQIRHFAELRRASLRDVEEETCPA